MGVWQWSYGGLIYLCHQSLLQLKLCHQIKIMAMLFVWWFLMHFLNNILVISWSSVLLVEETGGPGENYRPVAGHCQTLSNNVVHSPWTRFELTTSVVIGTDCIGSCKSNYQTIMAMTATHVQVNTMWLI